MGCAGLCYTIEICVFTVILLGLDIGQVRLHKFLYIQFQYYWAIVRQDSKWKFIESGNYGIRRELYLQQDFGAWSIGELSIL
ncbi:hypothetical protein TPENAI_61187 [Tenacibaculum litopenaei]